MISSYNKFLNKNLLRSLLFFISLLIVGFGQPALFSPFAIVASFMGFAIFWSIILDNSSRKQRFWLSTLWFALVQGIQHYWFLSHPYLYIYPFYLFLITGLGAQFGIIGILITRHRLHSVLQILFIAAIWTIMEWSRLFLLSGFSWGPVGLALSSHDLSRQFASFWGVYGLSFWVFLTNLLLVHYWISNRKKTALMVCAAVVLLPYIYGAIHLAMHQKKTINNNEELSVVLVQTAFPVEEMMAFKSGESAISFVLGEWGQILRILKNYQEKKIDMIVLPEYVVPYGTYYPVFNYEKVIRLFQNIFGESVKSKLPSLEEHLALEMEFQDNKKVWMVNNAFLAQAIANIFSADLILGLEDSDFISGQKQNNYNAALHITPQGVFSRYEKQVLVPMGEYIPFSFCKSLAEKYGVGGSFCCGEGAKLFSSSTNLPFGISICYEETYGHLMRSNKELGAKLLVNLTNDGWYPDSLLPKQHFEHSRLRTVEMGIPLIRACNTGITAAVDSLGRTISELDEKNSKGESLFGGLHAVVPITTHNTPYSFWGDYFIIALCSLLVFLLALNKLTYYDL